MKLLFISATAFFALAAAFGSGGNRTVPLPWRTSHFENVLGTSMEIKLIAASDAAAGRAEAAALAEIERLNGILSGYSRTSEFSRWAATRGQAVPVSPELMEVLKLWDAWRVRTNGALNPAAEAIGRVWKQAESRGSMPSAADMAAAAHAASSQPWSINEKAGTATRLNSAPLMLNSFTKTYIVERAAAAALHTQGVTAAVVNIGGDLVVRGAGSDAVSVADPRADAENSAPIAVLNLRDKAVATSGNYRRGYEIGGQHYSHIVDPRTGKTAEEIVGATVASPRGVDAGAMATAFCVLTPAQSRKLAASVPGTEYMLVAKNGATFYSAGWASLLAPQARMVAAAAAPQSKAAPTSAGLWNPGYELTVNVEIPQTKGFGARRPYVAVWIEDKDHFPVRTLAVLFEKARWLNELRAWYRDDRMRAMSEGNEILNSVTSATRSPGKYTFKWDGKDNSGKLVKDGIYTVLVEAAREHGSYTLDKHELNFNGEPAEVQMPAGAELGPVTLDYKKAAR